VCVCVRAYVRFVIDEVHTRKRSRIMWVTLLTNCYVYLYNFRFSASDMLWNCSSSTSHSLKACLHLPELSIEPMY
jgi:hypothetical protein